ncbi:MAG: lipoyl synthase [candidate division Zixibacteria bacterium]|nr:lipoyl synthase [candidate division Zixibacteria bacterium]
MEKLSVPSGLVKPPWLKVKACGNGKYLEVQSILKKYKLNTVCQEANCPNRGDCFSRGTATFLIMGPNCTRHCQFCNVTHGDIASLDENEPAHIARAVELLGLRHAVITSVTRDDLADGGALQFAKVVAAIRASRENITIEILTPDFMGCHKDLNVVLNTNPDIFNHNVETVPRLYAMVRPQANYHRSLDILKMAAETGRMAVKSGLMVGLGESIAELEQVFQDIQRAGVEYLTIGQYLAPSKNHHPVIKYYHPEEFKHLAAAAENCGIKSVFSAPLVRSSYHAQEQFQS